MEGYHAHGRPGVRRSRPAASARPDGAARDRSSGSSTGVCASGASGSTRGISRTRRASSPRARAAAAHRARRAAARRRRRRRGLRAARSRRALQRDRASTRCGRGGAAGRLRAPPLDRPRGTPSSRPRSRPPRRPPDRASSHRLDLSRPLRDHRVGQLGAEPGSAPSTDRTTDGTRRGSSGVVATPPRRSPERAILGASDGRNDTFVAVTPDDACRPGWGTYHG